VFPAQVKFGRIAVPVGFCSVEKSAEAEVEVVQRRVLVSSAPSLSFVLDAPDESFARYLREHGEHVRLDVILSIAKTTRETVKDEERAAEVRRDIDSYEKILKSRKLRPDLRTMAKARLKQLRQVSLKVDQLRADVRIMAHRSWLSRLSPVDEEMGFDSEGAEPDTTDAAWFDRYIFSAPASDAAFFSEYSLSRLFRMDQKCRSSEDDYLDGPQKNCSALATHYGRWDAAAAVAKRREYLDIACQKHEDRESCEALRRMPEATENEKATDDVSAAAGE
jgi:hypothetical protein